jgi:hypothetical protein
MKAILALVCFVAVATAVPIPWKNCGKAGDVIAVSQADASVWPPQRGKPITLTIAANVQSAIPDANYEAKITFSGIPIINKKGKLSDFKEVKLPIPAGPVSINQTINVPTIIPAGSTVGARVALTLASGAGVICVDVTIPFKVEEDEVAEVEVPEVPIPWKNCGKAGDVIAVSKADASVWPPQRGKPITLNIAANVQSAIPDANYEAKITFSGIPIINKKGKLSDFKEVKLPIPAGPVNLNQTINVPTIIPAGSTVGAHVALNLASGGGVICVDVTIPFKSDENEEDVFGAMIQNFFYGL